MKTSIFSRIFGAIVLVSFIAVTLVSVLSLAGQVKTFENSIIREKRSLLSFLKTASEYQDDVFISDEILRIVKDSGDIDFLWIVDEEGVIFYDSNEELDGKKIKDEFVSTDYFQERDVYYQDSSVKIMAQPIEGHEGERWTAFLGVNMVEIIAYLVPAFIRAASILLMAVIVSVFLSLALTEKIISPLLKLRRAITKISDQNLNERVDIKTGDEIEEIGIQFNKMAKRLRESRRELEETKEVLEVRVNARTKELEEMTDKLEEKVQARTQELERKVEELEKFHKLTVGREKKMINLKKENKKLNQKIDELEKEIKNLKN